LESISLKIIDLAGSDPGKKIQQVTGASKVHAVLGGFHLTGPMLEPMIGPTIGEMKKIGPDYIVPTHCTGWKAINEFDENQLFSLKFSTS
jgi:metal-dependent hydrolase (beta-lactamase superfamily II)